jgi:molybdopterin-dependent oxidoreductase alpha subunit
MHRPTHGGGWQAVAYTWRKAREVGGVGKLWKAMRSKNACKTCALGMGGQSGGMVNEAGHFPEVCKKSLQAMAADMQGAIKPEFFSTYSIAQLQAFSPRELESCGRLTQPLLHEQGAQFYRPITWDEANDRLAARLRAHTADESFWYFSGRSSNEAAFLLQLFARLYGTNNVNNCSFYCHQASGVGLTSVTGSGTATVTLDDLERADLVFVIGGNPASNHPRMMRSLMQVRRTGGQVVVINPVIEVGLVNFAVPSDVRSMLFGSPIASCYLQPHIGGDLALLTGIAKRIVELGAADQQFLNDYCDDAPAFLALLDEITWREIEQKSGVARDEIFRVADHYARAKRVVFSWTMGITHHANGVQNVQAIGNLALLRGMVGRAGSGLLPIRGHSNVQGIGSMGVTPKLRDAVFERLQNHFHVELPKTPGRDTLGCMEGADDGTLKIGVCLGGNLYGSNPDSNFAKQALAKLETLVYLSTTLNTGHAHGLGRETIILPVLARDEEPQATTQESMFNYVRFSEGGVRRHEGPRSEVEIVAELAERVLGETKPIPWRSMREARHVRQAISKIVPGFENLAVIDETKKEFQIPGRTFHEPVFATPSGRARMHRYEIPELTSTETTLRLMTVRSEGQFNTVVYEDYDLYRGQDRRDVILIHPDDFRRLGLKPDERVTVRSSAGELRGVLARSFEHIRAGNTLMYYPEANVLVSRAVDPASRTPAFKNIAVEIIRQGATALPVIENGALDAADAVGSPSRGKLKAC